MSYRRRDKKPVRTKLCSSCGEELAWEAKGCIHCGAGKVEVEDFADKRPGIVRFFSVPGITLSAVAALVLVGAFYLLTRDPGVDPASINRLREALSEVDARVEALTLRRTETEERATHEVWRARTLIKSGDADGHKAAQEKAEQLLAEVKRIQADLDGALDERSKITKELAALGASP